MRIIENIKKYIELKKKAENLREEITDEAYHYIEFKTKNEEKMHGKGKNFTKRAQRILVKMINKEDELEAVNEEMSRMKNWHATSKANVENNDDIYLIPKRAKRKKHVSYAADVSTDDVFIGPHTRMTRRHSRHVEINEDEVSKNDVYLLEPIRKASSTSYFEPTVSQDDVYLEPKSTRKKHTYNIKIDANDVFIPKKTTDNNDGYGKYDTYLDTDGEPLYTPYERSLIRRGKILDTIEHEHIDTLEK